MQRILPAYPLWIIDPDFSVWANTEKINSSSPVFWTGQKRTALGLVRYNGKTYRFLGEMENTLPLVQTQIKLTAFSTDYSFVCEEFSLSVSFISPLNPSSLEVASCPVCYTAYKVEPNAALPKDFSVVLAVGEDFCYNDPASVTGAVLPFESYEAAYITRARNLILSNSDDGVSPDCGDVFLVGDECFFCSKSAVENYAETGEMKYINASGENKYICAIMREKEGQFIIAHDDRVSVFYFGEWLNGYFFRDGRTIIDAINFSIKNYEKIIKECEEFDERLKEDCDGVGDGYYTLACAALRQSVGAHKLVRSGDGDLLFLSKECNSNGCVATVDVSYPSMPLYLIYNPELVNAMLASIFKFADMPVWNYDFAPHDVGTYPWCAGQVYGMRQDEDKFNCGMNRIEGVPHTNHRFYLFPAGSNIYDLKWQMPVEECGNMLVMTAAAILAGASKKPAKTHFKRLFRWVKYLLDFGLTPEDQLCTDDFAGHLKNNVNLAIKALCGIEAFSIICKSLGKKTMAAEYEDRARAFAKSLKELVGEGIMPLAYGQEESYSLKYNMLFDKLFGFDLLGEEVRQREISHYLTLSNEFGVPLDGRESYTKADWLLWVAAMAEDRATAEKIYKPVLKYLKTCSRRVPFSDWYDTVSGEVMHFYNRTVVGGVFAPLLYNVFDR